MADKVWTIEEIAKRWKVNSETVRRLIKSGKLDAFRAGGRNLRITQTALTEYEKREEAVT